MSPQNVPQLLERAYKNYRVFLHIPALQAACSSLGSLINLLYLVEKTGQNSPFSPADEDTYRDLVSGVNAMLSELETALKGVKEHHASIDSIREQSIRGHQNRLASFLEVLRSHSQEKITAALQHLRGIPNPEFQRSLLSSDWAVLGTELLKYGISQDLIDEEFLFIQNLLERNHREEEDEILRNHPVIDIDRREDEEELPGYTPGPQRGTIEEKAQSLEQTRRIMTMVEPEQFIPTSSNAAPPYTFEEGIEEDLDADISKCIKKAKEIEATKRLLSKEETPVLLPHPCDWLPKEIISEYKDSDEIIQMMDATSFSAMAYETAPRCLQQIERLHRLLRVSFEHKREVNIIEKVFQSLNIASTALSKFILVRDQHNNGFNFSDLDALDFKFSTVATIQKPHLQFPLREFEFAQKSYYTLLTYTMGFLEALSSVLSGLTFITLHHEELEVRWNNRKMDTRIAWMQKRLAGWEQVEEAVSFCRDWYGLRPELRLHASAALKEWERSKKILSGSEIDDVIDLTIISASNLPKSNFRPPSAFAKVVLYGPNKFGGAMRLFDLKTDPGPKTQNPVWNQPFLLKIPKNSKMIDVEIHDRVAGIDKELVRVRLKFSFIPGLEANFEGRSLMYGIDEEVEFPTFCVEGKGKQKEPSLLRIKLKWKGRYGRVEDLGLPAEPPGKMFRADFTGIPLTNEEREASKSGAKDVRRVRSRDQPGAEGL